MYIFLFLNLFIPGQAAFLPKYLESQFGLTPSQAAFLVGSVVVPAGALGTILGGFSLKKFNLNREGAMKLYISCQFIILPLYFGFLFNCPTSLIAGVNTPYLNETLVQQKLTQCNFGCDCSYKQGKLFVVILQIFPHLNLFCSRVCL